MAASSTLDIRLSPEASFIVQDAVEAGEYATPEALIEGAVRQWQKRKIDTVIETLGGIEVVRKLVDEGLQRGPSRPLDIEEIKNEGRRRIAARARQTMS